MALRDEMSTRHNSQGVEEVWAVRVDGRTYPIAGGDGAAEAERKENEAARVGAERERGAAERARVGAEAAREGAERERELAQRKNDADQAANNRAAQGLQVVKLAEGQFDPGTLAPTVPGEPGKLYFAPSGDAEGDSYVEWMLLGGAWERVGMSNATLEALTTAEIDRAASGASLASKGVLDGGGLAYLCAKAGARFARASHAHAAKDVSGLPEAVPRMFPKNYGASGYPAAVYLTGFGPGYREPGHLTAQQLRGVMGLGEGSGPLPVAHGGTGASTNHSARANLGMHRLIWSGAWTGGAIHVPDVAGYRLIAVETDDSLVITAYRKDGAARFAGGGNMELDGSFYSYGFSCSVTGGALSNKQLVRKRWPAESMNNLAVRKIWGIA